MDANASAQQTEQALVRLRTNLARWCVPDRVVDQLVELRFEAGFDKGASLFSAGGSADPLGFVLSGFAKVYCPIADGGRTLTRLVGAGEILGHADFTDQSGRRAQIFEAAALSNCTVAFVTRADISRVLRSLDPDTLVQLIGSLNRFWALDAHWFATLLGLTLWQRLEAVLTDLAVRFGARDVGGTLVTPKLSHQDFAEMIGSSRPMVSRLIRLMMDNRMLARCRNRYLLLEKWNLGESVSAFDHAGAVEEAPRGQPGRVESSDHDRSASPLGDAFER